MPAIKPTSAIRDKWLRRASTASPEYEEGVRNPKKDWASAASAAENNYKAGVTQAASEGRFGKGVQRAGTAKWQANAIAKGPGRFSQGVTVAGDAYQQGFEPFAQAIASATLPDRYPTGDDRNIQRVIAMNKALRKKKLQGA